MIRPMETLPKETLRRDLVSRLRLVAKGARYRITFRGKPTGACLVPDSAELGKLICLRAEKLLRNGDLDGFAVEVFDIIEGKKR